jgi:hypothetical protein
MGIRQLAFSIRQSNGAFAYGRVPMADGGFL